MYACMYVFMYVCVYGTCPSLSITTLPSLCLVFVPSILPYLWDRMLVDRCRLECCRVFPSASPRPLPSLDCCCSSRCPSLNTCYCFQGMSGATQGSCKTPECWPASRRQARVEETTPSSVEGASGAWNTRTHIHTCTNTHIHTHIIKPCEH